FTGGSNIAAPWWPDDDTVEPWRDDMIRGEGPAVKEVVRLFEGRWQLQTGQELELFGQDRGGEHQRDSDQHVSVLGEAYYRNRRQIAHAYLANMWRAERRIWITNSYFVPDRAVVKALVRAAERGVDVRVL